MLPYQQCLMQLVVKLWLIAKGVSRGVTTEGFGGGDPNLLKRYTRWPKAKKRSGKITENLVEKSF